VTNVYADVGQLFAQSTIADPRVSAVMIGQLIKGMGADHVCWGRMRSGRIAAMADRSTGRLEIPEDLQKKYALKPLGPATVPSRPRFSAGTTRGCTTSSRRQRAALENDSWPSTSNSTTSTAAGRTNLAYGYALKNA